MENITQDLVYTSEAAITRSLFYRGLNDINVYVEDIDQEYIYETILKRLLKDRYSIKAIFAVGGKNAVIQSYREFGSINDGQKNVYIVDGDFDRYVCPESMVRDKCFVYLQTYNIENYFIDEAACISFAKGRLKCSDKRVKEMIKFTFWRDTIVRQASKLFFYYCTIKKHYPEVPTISRTPYIFIDSKTGFERDNAFTALFEEFYGIDKCIEEKMNAVRNAYREINGEDYFCLICGKFLLTSLECYLRSIIKCRIDKEDFRWYLINHFDIEKLDYLKEAIINNAL